MKELVVSHKFDLKSNMKEVKSSIAEAISKYDVVVVEDRLGEAKELMATFNKEKKAFSDQCKKFLGVIAAPIDEFKAQQKEIEKMYDDGRAKIAAQVEKFEAKKLDDIKALILAYRDEKCKAADIDINSVTVIDLVMLSAVSTNSKGYSLAKKTVEVIDQRIQAVENQILKARLEAEEKAKKNAENARRSGILYGMGFSFTGRDYVLGSLKVSNDTVIDSTDEQFTSMIEDLKKSVKAQNQEKAAVEQQKPIETPQPEVAPKQASQPAREQEPQPETTPDRAVADDGKTVFTIRATFDVKAPANAPIDKIISKLTGMMEAAGITSLTKIEVI